MKLSTSSSDETQRIGYLLGKSLKPNSVVCLYGELGAGKTIMTKGIATAFGIDERDVGSASFVLIAEHEGSLPFYHIDLYRLTQNETHELGLYEYFFKNGVCVIEWAERAEDELPDDVISVKISALNHDSREIEIIGINREALKEIEQGI
jgi:tRNA threonylcarbamoyladenosine biosynthesis protein TsaE